MARRRKAVGRRSLLAILLDRARNLEEISDLPTEAAMRAARTRRIRASTFRLSSDAGE